MKSYDETTNNLLDRRDEYIVEQKARRKKLTTVTSVVVCLAIVATIGLSYGDWFRKPAMEPTHNNNPSSTPFTTEIDSKDESAGIVATTNTGIASMISPHWDDLIISEKFREIKLDDITYSSQLDEIGKEHILEFISEADMTGYDKYEDKTYTEKGKIYSINHISTKCAVAVQIGEDEAYHIFINLCYVPETLGDFIADLDLRNTIVFGDVYYDTYEYSKTFSKHTRRTYENVDDSVIWNMLLSDTSLKNVEYNHPYDRISVETDIPILGYKNISFSVTTDGYIITNILNDQKCFFVGKEKTDAFAKYLEDNIVFKEHTEVYEYNSDGSIPGKSEVIITQ